VGSGERVKLYGRKFTKRELLDAVGDADQLGGATPSVLTDGPASGSRVIVVRNPSGLSFVCLVDRGLDLGWADYCGVPLAWRSPVGDIGPTFAEPTGQGWLRTFGGGLITTCGLTSAGQPSMDQGKAYGLHGRYSSIPAREVAWSTDWNGDERIVMISGRVREASALGPVIELKRTITTTLGSGSLRVHDVVTNLGASLVAHMFRYHVNFGFPMIDHESRIEFDAATVQPRDAQSRAGLPNWKVIASPSEPVAEEVFTAISKEADKEPCVAIINPVPRPSLRLYWSGATLPLLLVWKQPTRRTYVTALEPSNCRDDGRATARADGTLIELEPDEERHYWLELNVNETAGKVTANSSPPSARSYNHF